MIIAIVGTYDDTWLCNPMGNGKSNTMTYFGLEEKREGKKVYANYKIDFGEKMQILDMIDRVLTEDSSGYALLLDEIQLVVDQDLNKNLRKKFINQFVAQSRKRSANIYYTTQRYKNVAKKLRDVTTLILWPVKRHLHGGDLIASDPRYVCNDDTCKEPHQIDVYQHIPFLPYPLVTLRPELVAKHYNSDEIVIERVA